jgi:hypothetical protein
MVLWNLFREGGFDVYPRQIVAQWASVPLLSQVPLQENHTRDFTCLTMRKKSMTARGCVEIAEIVPAQETHAAGADGGSAVTSFDKGLGSENKHSSVMHGHIMVFPWYIPIRF